MSRALDSIGRSNNLGESARRLDAAAVQLAAVPDFDNHRDQAPAGLLGVGLDLANVAVDLGSDLSGKMEGISPGELSGISIVCTWRLSHPWRK